jgi:hypothetical protein
MVQTWQKFYENETQRNAGNPTAPIRAELMKKVVSFVVSERPYSPYFWAVFSSN